jgi:hypothetical protein
MLLYLNPDQQDGGGGFWHLTIFQLYVVVSFIGGGNWGTQRSH